MAEDDPTKSPLDRGCGILGGLGLVIIGVYLLQNAHFYIGLGVIIAGIIVVMDSA